MIRNLGAKVRGNLQYVNRRVYNRQCRARGGSSSFATIRGEDIRKFYKFRCKAENRVKWTVVEGTNNYVLPGDVVRPIRSDRVESMILQGDAQLTADDFLSESKAEIKNILPPLLYSDYPPAIFGIGLNYKRHAKEVGLKVPAFPIYFMKNPMSVCGYDDDVVVPHVCSDEIDYEVELAVVLKEDVKNVSVLEAEKYILGYTVCNDVSARKWQGPKRGGGQWNRAKSFDTFCPLGPCLAINVKDPNNLKLRTKVNGTILQESNTGDMIFKIPELLSFLSQGTTLPKGSLLLTGTPEGVGFSRDPPVFLQEGDKVEVTVDGVGTLRNAIARK